MAKKWSFVMGILFVTGAISGTIISIQLSTLWPTFMALAGKVIGLPFYLETFAFFIEAIFLGIYLYSWNRFSHTLFHWLCSLPIVFGSVTSAFFITTANAFMNSPQGFIYKNGVISHINPLNAMFNQATPTETIHSIVSYYLTTCLCFAAVYAWFLFSTKDNQLYNKKALFLLVSLSFVFAILIGITGDASARYLVEHEPEKLAAAEYLFKTEKFAPIKIGGIVKEYNERYSVFDAITLPGMLSFLGYGRSDAKVIGLDDFNHNAWPPLWIHYMFDAMVGIGILITLIPLGFLLLYKWKRNIAYSNVMLFGIFISGVMGFVAVECGWILTEVGRQPFVIRGIMTTQQAFTTNKSVIAFAFLFPLLYLVLFVATIWILVMHYKKNKLILKI